MRSALMGLAGVTLVVSGLQYNPGRGGSTLEGPLTVNGSVTMTTGPHVVDGGVIARTYEGGSLTMDAGTFESLSVTGAASLGPTSAPSVTSGSFVGGTASVTNLTVSGTTNFGTVNMGALTTTGPNTLNGSTSVTGACTFSQPPTGLVRKGSLVRGAALGLSIGCQDLGTVAVAGTTLDSACNVTRRPAPILNLGITLDCFVATPGIVTVRACSLLALLSAPSGTYGVTLVGE